jgi:hypothetical protein
MRTDALRSGRTFLALAATWLAVPGRAGAG